MQYKKVQKSSWNEPYSSSSFTKQSCSKMALWYYFFSASSRNSAHTFHDLCLFDFLVCWRIQAYRINWLCSTCPPHVKKCLRYVPCEMQNSRTWSMLRYFERANERTNLMKKSQYKKDHRTITKCSATTQLKINARSSSLLSKIECFLKCTWFSHRNWNFR